MNELDIRSRFRQYDQLLSEVRQSLANLPGRSPPSSRDFLFTPCVGKLIGRRQTLATPPATPVVQIGKYIGYARHNGESTAKNAGALQMPEGVVMPDEDFDALFLNLADNGAAESLLNPTTENPIWVIGLIVGYTAEDNAPGGLKTRGGAPIVMFCLGAGGDGVKFGKVATAWEPGDATVSLTPIDPETNDTLGEAVDVIIEMPGAAPPLAFGNEVDDVLPYMATGGYRFLVSYRKFIDGGSGQYDYLGNGGGPGAPNFVPMPVVAT